MTGTVNGRDFASHPLVKKSMKGVFQRKPSLPRYCVTWSVGQVLSYLEQQTLSDISLKDLTLKVTMLLCLLTGQRLQTLAAVHLDHMALNDHQCILYINEILKFTRPGKHIAPITPRRYVLRTNLKYANRKIRISLFLYYISIFTLSHIYNAQMTYAALCFSTKYLLPLLSLLTDPKYAVVPSCLFLYLIRVCDDNLQPLNDVVVHSVSCTC